MTAAQYATKLLKIAKSATAAAKKMPPTGFYPWRNDRSIGFLKRGAQAARNGEDPLTVLDYLIEAYKTTKSPDGLAGEMPKDFLASEPGRVWENHVHPDVVAALLLMEERDFEVGAE